LGSLLLGARSCSSRAKKTMLLYFALGSVVLVALVWFFFFKSASPNYDRKFKDKVVVITGASSGLGWEIAKNVSQYRPKLLVIAARTQDKLDELKDLCTRAGAKEVLPVVTNVASRESCKNLVAETLKKYNTIDVLFLNAGVSQMDRIRNTSIEVLDQVMQTNYNGVTDIAFFALDAIRTAKGHIVVTSSVVQRLCMPGAAAYCASKAAVSAFFDCLRTEESKAGVKVTVLCPGFVPTSVVANSLTGSGEKFGKTKSLPFRMELAPAVQLAIDAVASDKMEVWYTMGATLTMMLRGVAPNLTDRLLYKVR